MDSQEKFIPAKENRPMIWFFRWYIWFLCKLRFKKVYINNQYVRKSECPAIFLANHHSWWDALIPLILNERIFKFSARAIMDLEQLIRYPFFSRLGVFSVDRSNARSALKSLDYAVDWLREPNSCLFFYPQGKITFPQEPIHFERGYLRILNSLEQLDVVFMFYHYDLSVGSKPALFLQTQKIEIDLQLIPSKEKLHELIQLRFNENYLLFLNSVKLNKQKFIKLI